MSTPLIGHLDPEFIEIMGEIQSMLQMVFEAPDALMIPVSGTGSAGMEAALCNFIEEGDELKVADFGQAAGLEEDAGVKGLVGTFPYLGPELVEGHSPDEQTDIYALGVVFYEMLSGETPFGTTSVRELFLKQLSHTVPALGSVTRRMIFIRDVLPSPLGPTRARHSPARTASVISCTTSREP